MSSKKVKQKVYYIYVKYYDEGSVILEKRYKYRFLNKESMLRVYENYRISKYIANVTYSTTYE